METNYLKNPPEQPHDDQEENGQTASLTQRLGGVEYDHKLHSSVEPVYEQTSLHHTISGLIIHNPDQTQLRVDLSAYKGLGSGETRNLRNALLETYQREAQTEYGTSLLTESTQYIKSISWVTLKNSEVQNDASQLQASIRGGILQGSFLRKSQEAQSEIFYQQHEALLYAIDNASFRSLHSEHENLKKPSIPNNHSGETLMNKHTTDPIERALSGNTLLSQTGISTARLIDQNENITPGDNPETLNDLLAGHHQQTEILKLMLQKQNESKQSTATETANPQNELDL